MSLLLMGGLFLALGFMFGYGILNTFQGYRRTSSRVKVPARLQSVEPREHSGRGGGFSETVATYAYEFQGKGYTSDRVTLFLPTCGFYPEMAARCQSGTPIRVFVDPLHPEYSVINRDFAAWHIALSGVTGIVLFFGGVFLLVGAIRAPSVVKAGWSPLGGRIESGNRH